MLYVCVLVFECRFGGELGFLGVVGEGGCLIFVLKGFFFWVDFRDFFREVVVVFVLVYFESKLFSFFVYICFLFYLDWEGVGLIRLKD